MRRLALVLAVLAGVAALPAGAAAVVPGPNGPLIFTSGRDDGATALTDTSAQIWFLSGPLGSASRVTSQVLHHRHASWSPDRTKIAYARGPDRTFVGPWDIYVQDLTNPRSAPVQMTNTPSERGPANWSPDGTRLAYAKEVAASSWNVVTALAKALTVGVRRNGCRTEASSWNGCFWSVQSAAVVTERPEHLLRADVARSAGYDIYRARRRAAAPHRHFRSSLAQQTTIKPAVSPDGTRLCFTRQGK